MMASTVRLLKIFEKELSKTDAECRLAFPSRHIHHFCNSSIDQSSMEFQVHDVGGRPFRTRLNVRKKGRYKKPEVMHGWLQFVHAKGLKSSDKVIFYKHPGRSLFTVAIRRAVWSFGVVLGHNSAEE